MRAAHLRAFASRDGGWRRALVLFMLGAMLYGLGLQSVRACLPTQLPSNHHVTVQLGGASEPCHGDDGVTRATCESHCRGEATGARSSSSLDLPAAVPVDIGASLTPAPIVLPDAGDALPPPPRLGPPLHLLFHRFLR